MCGLCAVSVAQEVDVGPVSPESSIAGSGAGVLGGSEEMEKPGAEVGAREDRFAGEATSGERSGGRRPSIAAVGLVGREHILGVEAAGPEETGSGSTEVLVGDRAIVESCVGVAEEGGSQGEEGREAVAAAP